MYQFCSTLLATKESIYENSIGYIRLARWQRGEKEAILTNL